MRYLTPDTPATHSLTPRAKKSEMAVATLTPETTPTKSPITATTTTTAAAACSLQLPKQTQTRRRPIRTYSKKRPFSDTAADGTSAAEPAVKRQNTQRTMAQQETAGGRRAPSGERQAREESRQKDEEDKPERGPATCLPSPRRRMGILRYFQPEATPPRSASSAAAPAAAVSASPSTSLPGPGKRTQSSPEDHARSPPAALERSGVLDASDDAAEAVPRRRRQKRRLTIRPDNLSSPVAKTARTTGPMAKAGFAAEETEAANATGDDDQDKENRRQASGGGGGEGCLAASSSRMQQRPTNRAANTTTTVVQTTLSLAILGSDGVGGSGSVKECRECNILYNPLHEKDAKFHARYHASFCRSKKTVRQEEQ